MSSYIADELIDIKPSKGLYVHSTSEPFNEEGEIDEERTRTWLAKYGLCSRSGGSQLSKMTTTLEKEGTIRGVSIFTP